MIGELPTSTGTPPPTSTPFSTSRKGSKHLGAIIGSAVGAIALIILIAIGVFLFRKHNSKDLAMNTDPVLPVTQQTQPHPGYIWDPQTQQYYPSPHFPGNSPHFGGDPLQFPKNPQGPVEIPTESPFAELPVHEQHYGGYLG